MPWLTAGGLIKVTDAYTTKLKRWENGHGVPLAVVDEEGNLVLTYQGERGRYQVKGEKLVLFHESS